MPGNAEFSDFLRLLNSETSKKKKRKAEKAITINGNDNHQMNGDDNLETIQKANSRFVQVIAAPENLQPTPSIFKKSNEEQSVENSQALDIARLKMYDTFSKTKNRFEHSLKIIGDEERPQREILQNFIGENEEAINDKTFEIVEPELNVENDSNKSISEQSEEEPEVRSLATQTESPVTETRKRKNVIIYPYQVPHKKAFLFHLHHPSDFSFIGKMKITLLFGHIEIFGYSLSFDSQTHSADLYFPKFCTSPSIETKEPIENTDPEDLESLLTGSNLIDDNDLKKLIKEFKPHDSLILIEETIASFVKVFEKYFDRSLFSELPFEASALTEVAQSLQCVFNLNGSYLTKEFRKNPEWDALPLKSRNIICGGKNVGKSSVLKYLINRSLSKYPGVVCLDFDPGQSEFTPPGCLSVVLIKEPVLGPNFTHVIEAERMVFLGNVDVSQCPTAYLQAVSHIVEFYKQDPVLSEMPCFVNAMGYCKGLGVALTISALKILKPDTVIQIVSTDDKNNYPFHLTPDSLNFDDGFLFPSPENSNFTYDFHLLKSYAEESGVKLIGGLKPRELRDLMLLSYFSQMVSPLQPNFNSVQPYSVSFSKLYLAVHDAISQHDILKAFNGNMIALCQYKEDPSNEVLQAEDDYFKILIKPSIMPCLGLGFVRGIDSTAKKIYIITHLSSFILESVNCLMLGSVSPPHSIYLKQDTVEGPIVYTSINTGENVQRVRRTFKFSNRHTP